MPGAIAIFMEGVVLDEDPTSYAASVSIPEGLALARLLSEVGPTHFVTSSTEDIAKHWLRINGVRYMKVIEPNVLDAWAAGTELQCRQIVRMQAARTNLWLVVTADPRVSAWCYDNAQASLTLASPRHSNFVVERRSWEQLAEQTQRNRELLAQAEVEENFDE